MLEGIDWGIVLWLLAGIISGVGELLTGSLFLLPFAVGAFAAAAAAALGAGGVWIAVVFMVATVGTLAWAVRFGKKVNAAPPATREGANRYVNVLGVVTSPISRSDSGRVRVGTESWRALSRSGAEIQVDQPVRVVEVWGNALVVEVETEASGTES